MSTWDYHSFDASSWIINSESASTWTIISSTLYITSANNLTSTTYYSSLASMQPEPRLETPCPELAEATTKAEELLKQHIGEEAFGLLYKVGHIELDSRKYPGRKYRIPQNHMSYIEVLDEEGKVIDTLCIHPQVECPPADQILSRFIFLESAEDYVLATANHHGARR